jgi:hypothetical protein
MIGSDAALGLAVLFLYLAMMLWGVFQTFWPSEPRINLPGGGHKVRKWEFSVPAPAPENVSTNSGRPKQPLCVF